MLLSGEKISGRLASMLMMLFIIFCCALPLFWLVLQLVKYPQALSEIRFTGYRGRLLVRTIGYNSLVAFLAVLMGLPAAFVIGRGKSWVAKALMFLIPLPLVLPSITYAYGWSQQLRLLHFFLFPAGTADVCRCIWTLATWLWALPAVLIGLALRNLDINVQQFALLEGAYWRVTMRMLIGPIVAAFCLTMILAIQEFAVYEPTGISVTATEIRAVFDTGMMNLTPEQMARVSTYIPAQATDKTTDENVPSETPFPSLSSEQRSALAVAAAIPSLLVIGVLSLIAFFIARKLSFSEQIHFGNWPSQLNSGPLCLIFTLFFLVISLFMPAWAMYRSLSRPISFPRMIATYSPEVIGSMWNAVLTGILAIALAVIVCIRKSRVGFVVGLIGFLAGGQLLAIANIRLYNRPWLNWIYNGSPIVIMAYLARFGWIAMLVGQSTWSGAYKSLRESAQLDGADRVGIFWYIIRPLTTPLILAGGILVMTLSLTEVPASVLLSPPRVLIPLLMSWVHVVRYDEMIEASLLLMCSAALLGLISMILIQLSQRFIRKVFVDKTLVFLSLCLILSIAGCKKSTAPDEVWLESGASDGQVVYPRAIAYSPTDDSMYIVDRMARIQHLDKNGKCIKSWRMPSYAQGKPVGLSVGKDKNLYVPDTHYARIIVFSPDGKIIREWGSFGTGPGQFTYPTDIAFDDQDHIYVSEYGDHDRIQVFDGNGKFLYQFGKFGQGNGEFSRPQSMLIEKDIMYITDACNHRICVFKTDGTWIRNICQLGSGPGDLRFPYGLDQDAFGNLVVCEFGNNRIQKIDKQTGKSLGTWGHAGREPGELAYPWAVICDKNKRSIIIDSGNNRLQVVRF